MARREFDLFARVANFTALREATLRAARGKRHKPRVAEFLAGLETEVLRLQRELLERRWRPGGYTEFIVRESKPRLISAAPFRDRVVHHALYAVIGPLFERGFIARSYASIKGRGSHRAVATYEKLSTPSQRRRGLPIGNLTSQLFGNLYLDPLDHYVSEVLRAPYLRYLDDFALFDDDPEQLAQWRRQIKCFLERRRLLLHPGKTQVMETAVPTQFLGYVLGPGSRRRLPEENLIRLRGRLRSLRDRWRVRSVSSDEVKQRLGAWVAHARHADTVGLRHGLFRGGWFDPRWTDGTQVTGAAERRQMPRESRVRLSS